MVFPASLLGAQHKRNSVESKSASLLAVSLRKVLNGMSPSSCARQVDEVMQSTFRGGPVLQKTAHRGARTPMQEEDAC